MSFILQIFNGLNEHLVLVCEVIHITLQQIHFLLQEEQKDMIQQFCIYNSKLAVKVKSPYSNKVKIVSSVCSLRDSPPLNRNEVNLIYTQRT